jgi:hypothetical protein
LLYLSKYECFLYEITIFNPIDTKINLNIIKKDCDFKPIKDGARIAMGQTSEHEDMPLANLLSSNISWFRE